MDKVSGFRLVRPHTVKLSTAGNMGCGFLVDTPVLQSGRPGVLLATAWHVIQSAVDTAGALDVYHFSSGNSCRIPASDFGVLSDKGRDLAVVFFERSHLPDLPVECLHLLDDVLPPGQEISWCGYPAGVLISWSIKGDLLCHFSGTISASYGKNNKDYLIDGVTINGISGGPAYLEQEGKLIVVGVVTNYYPNIQRNGVLPGLGAIRGIDEIMQSIRAASGSSDSVLP